MENAGNMVRREFWKLEGKSKGKDGDVYNIVASTNDIDRMGEIVEPRGLANLDRYRRNKPVILLNHLWTVPPVGKAIDGDITDRDVRLAITFAPTALGQEVKTLYDGGFMSAFSIGFQPLELGMRSIDGIEHRVYTKWDLMETSCVDVPANESALIVRSARAKGIDLPALTAALLPTATSAPHGGKRDERRSWALSLADRWDRSHGRKP